MIKTKRGAKTYNTGRPCRNGHLGERYVSGRNCVTCACERSHARFVENPEAVREASRRYGEKNRERKNARNKRYHAATREIRLAQMKRYDAANRERRLAQLQSNHKEQMS